MHPNSLANLCPAPRFSRNNRPCKKRTLTDAQLEEAIKLRESGFAWRMLGDRYGVNHDTLRLAVRDRGQSAILGAKNLAILGGQNSLLVLPYLWLPRVPICGSLRLPIKPTNQAPIAQSNGSIGLLSPFLFSQNKAITTEQLWGLSDEDACGE